MGSAALAGMIHLTVGSKLKGLGDGEVAFHREVMEELDALPQFQKLSPTEKFDAYTLVCTERLDRYSFRERMAVYEEQIKAAAPERKQDVKKPDPEVDQANEERSKAIRGLAATALKGAHHSHQFMENIEGVGSMSL
jgi:hypothetical protein